MAGSSKVEEMTSPFTERCMSVTSSGRSSISSTIRNTSGWLSVIARAMFCSSTVLPVRGGATISARWPLPCGETMSITRADLSLMVGSALSSVELRSRDRAASDCRN